MDEAYRQHSNQARRKNRSTTNLNHLTLAPLTSKLPLHDADIVPDSLAWPPQHNLSYLQGKSAPTTPALLTRSPVVPSRSHSRSRSAGQSRAALPKSKSTTQLANASHTSNHRGRKVASGTVSPNLRRRKDDQTLSWQDRSDSDWLLRAGALISSETREYKGQAWLVSRASSTSLTGMRDAEEETFERELAREREMASRHNSRRGSLAIIDDNGSPIGSRRASRSHSRVGSRTQLLTPLDRHADEGYFVRSPGPIDSNYNPKPDLVNLDEKLEALEQDTSQEDEATIRRLVKNGHSEGGSWVSNLIGWSLFSVEENEEESEDGEDDADGDEDVDTPQRRDSIPSGRHFEGVSNLPEERVPPPKEDEGGWRDAAWLLSVASKVIL